VKEHEEVKSSKFPTFLDNTCRERSSWIYDEASLFAIEINLFELF